MPTFAYSAVEPSGRKRTGVLEAADQQAAVALLTREGKFLLDIKEQAKASESAESHDGERKKSKSTRADLALFTRRMADLSDAGLPLDRVLSVLAEQSESLPLSKAAEAALTEVQGGLSVSDALALQGTKLFPEVYTQTLRAGEASGQFPESAERLADLLENEVTRRSQVVSALVYPAVLTGVAVFVVVFLLTFVVPRLSGVFKGMGDNLPAVTKFLLATTGFITTNWLLLIGVMVGGFVMYRGWIATPAGALSRDRLLMKLPMAGPIVKKSTVSRYARVLGTLLHGGVSILEALDLSGKSTGNLVFATTSESVLQDVKEGIPIADAMKNTGAFPPVLTHMVAIGEETGDLPKMLNRVSESLDFEVEQGLRRLTASLEPIIVLVMGAFVAFVVLSIMLPIVQAQELVK